MTEPEEREHAEVAAVDIERRLRADMATTIVRAGIADPTVNGLLDELVDDAMHQVTQLLIARNARDREDYLT